MAGQGRGHRGDAGDPQALTELARAFAALVVSAVALAAGTPAHAQFVQRSGAGFTLNGSPWRFLGYNYYQLTSDREATKCNRVISDSTVDAVLSDAKAAGATVIRTWFFQHYYRQAGDSYAPFDRVLGKARMLVFDGTHLFRAALKPFRANAAVVNTDETILNGVVPGSIAVGVFTFAVVPVRVGADAVDTSNWLSAPGQATFNL